MQIWTATGQSHSCRLVCNNLRDGIRKANINFSAYEGPVGFISEPAAIGVGPKDKGFLRTLYQQGQIEELRFGLALGSSGQGKQILGGVDDSLFEGNLTRVPIQYQWAIGGAAVTAGGSVVDDKQFLLFDSGGPQVSRISDTASTQ